MSEEISQALTRLFDRHRIVLWYDHKRELQAEFEDVALPGVAKITLRNNQFGIKHRILRQEQERKFLLYHADPSNRDAGQCPRRHHPTLVARWNNS